MKKNYILFVVLVFISTTFAQEIVKQKAPLKMDESSFINRSFIPLSNSSPQTAANYIAVDTMANSFGPAANTLNPLAYDPITNILAVVHRGKIPYAVSSGELWWNYSTDLGISWQRSNTSVQNGTLSQNSARYPNMTLANLANSSNMADLLGAFSWPELSQTGSGWLGYGISEGLLQSAFANIDQGPPAYGANVPTFCDDSWIFWCADNLSDNSIRLWRTQDYSTIEIIDPPTWGTTRWTNGNIPLGGVAHNGNVYVGVIGSFTEEIGAGGWEIGYSKSTDHGATWSDWFVPDWRTINALQTFTELWDWKVGDTYVSYSGDIQVDADGNVHFVTGLSDSGSSYGVIVEIYETAPNVWDGKIIAWTPNLSDYGYNSNDPGLGQTGPSIMMAANKQRDFFAVQYTTGSPETGYYLCDLYVHTRALSDANWSGSTNLTATNTMNEDGCHLAPYIATYDSTDYIFSMFWYEQGNTTPTIDQTAQSVIWVAPYAVRSTVSIPVTFQVDMRWQIANENFPAGANIVVRGNFQTDAGDPNGNWQGNLFQLSNPDGDSIYTGTFQIPANFVGNNYSFKYVIVNPPAGDDWESTPDRIFTLTSPSTVILLECFEDDCGWFVNEVTNTINFTADISGILGIGIGGAFNPSQDSLLVMGLDWDNYGKLLYGNRKMINTDPFNIGIYTTTLIVMSDYESPNGEGDSTNWKFRAFPDSRFLNSGWETGPDRWHFYQAQGTIITLPTIIPRIYPNFGVSTADIDFTLNVDMTGAVNRYNGEPIPVESIDFVVVRGSVPWLGSNINTPCWCTDDTTNGSLIVLTHSSGNIWSYHTILPTGTDFGPFEFRFGAMYPGADTVNGGIAYLQNEFSFGINHTYVLLDHPISISYNCFGFPSCPDAVEQIRNIIPEKFILEQNYPNPFNPTTKIRYGIPELTNVKLTIYNLLGEEISTLVNVEQRAGVYEATFDASNLPSGIYFYTLQTDKFSTTNKMLLLK